MKVPVAVSGLVAVPMPTVTVPVRTPLVLAVTAMQPSVRELVTAMFFRTVPTFGVSSCPKNPVM